MFLTGSEVSLPTKVSLRAGVVLGDRVSLGRDVKIRRSIVWNDASLGYGCDVSDSILGSGVILPPNSRFHHRIVLARGEDLPRTRGRAQGDLIHSACERGRPARRLAAAQLGAATRLELVAGDASDRRYVRARPGMAPPAS
jgi:NDP-sugar pyrophosphorylase family protein